MRIPVERQTGTSLPTRSIARWLVVAVVLLILYGSLYPFRFSALGEIGFWELLRGLGFQRSSRSDLVANLLLYVPLGICLTLAWPARWLPSSALAWSAGLGTLLSILIELLQVHASLRVPSLTDVVLNAVGTTVGALLALSYRALGRSSRIPGIAGGRPEPAPFAVVLLWLAFRLAPFIPAFDWAKYKQALQPIYQDPQFAVPDTFRFMTGWLVAAYAVRQVWQRQSALAAVAALVAVVLLGRIVVVGKALVIPELLGIAAAAGVGAMLILVPDRRRSAVLAALLGAVVLLEGLKPFDLVGTSQGFSWIPLRSSLSGRLEINYSILLEKAFWYFSLVWLLARRGWRPVHAAAATALLLAAIEIVQMWLPERSAEITDPLLALIAGVLVVLLGTGIYSRR